MKNYVIVLSVPFVHHTELQNFLIAPCINEYFWLFWPVLAKKYRDLRCSRPRYQHCDILAYCMLAYLIGSDTHWFKGQSG